MKPEIGDLYSRSAGFIENDALLRKRVTIIGLGSFGSQIAVELAKAAVGSFTLVDFDKLEAHNIVRHACFLKDVGRLKVDAVEDLILGKNPYAVVEKLAIDIASEDASVMNAIANSDIVICATDNNASRFKIAALTTQYGKTCIYGRANTRAEGGDVFIQRRNGPCYGCLLGVASFDPNAEEVASKDAGLRSGKIAGYTSEEDANAIIQVGLSSDITPITNMMVKLALVELSKGTAGGLAKLEDEYVYDYWIWANRRDRRFANWSPFPQAGANPTILRWYGAHIGKDEGCALCGSGEVALDD